MPSSRVGGPVPQRPGASWHEPQQASAHAGPSRGPEAPPGLPSRSRREPAAAMRQRLQAQVKAHAQQVEQLTSLQQAVIAQAGRVQKKLNLAREEPAARTEAPEIQPATPLAAQAAGPAGQRKAEEELSLLAWRHRHLGERQQRVAEILQGAATDLATAQERLSALGPPPAPDSPEPTPRPPLSSPASMPGSPGPEASVRLLRQASDLGRTVMTLESRLEAVQEEASGVRDLLDKARAAFEASEKQIGDALVERGQGGHAHLDKENGRAYSSMIGLQKRMKQLGHAQETLLALLAPARRDLRDIQQRLAQAGARPAPGASQRSLFSTPSARQAGEDMALLLDALNGEGAAVARLAERAARRAPRTLAGWLRRPFSKGAAKPLGGKRQGAFMELVRTDVMKVARHGHIPPGQAAHLMAEAVECTALGESLTPHDRAHLLASLGRLRAELANTSRRNP